MLLAPKSAAFVWYFFSNHYLCNKIDYDSTLQMQLYNTIILVLFYLKARTKNNKIRNAYYEKDETFCLRCKRGYAA